MNPEPDPSSIVARMIEVGHDLEQWADTHRTATLAEHERGVLALFRGVMGPILGSVLERAQGLDQPSAQRLHSICPKCGARCLPHHWQQRQPVTVCGPAPYMRPIFRCTACQTDWVPADLQLDLQTHQRLSAELALWVADTGAKMPFRQAAEHLERLTGIGLGAETIRSHTELVGSVLVDRQRQASVVVGQSQEAAEDLDPVPGLLVVETDGVMVRYQDDCHEVKIGEVAGSIVGNGHERNDPEARPPRLVAPSDVASRASAEQCGPLLLAEAARRGGLEIEHWEQPPGTDERLKLVGPATAVLRPGVVLGDGAVWIWNLAAEQFGMASDSFGTRPDASQPGVWGMGQLGTGAESGKRE